MPDLGKLLRHVNGPDSTRSSRPRGLSVTSANRAPSTSGHSRRDSTYSEHDRGRGKHRSQDTNSEYSKYNEDRRGRHRDRDEVSYQGSKNREPSAATTIRQHSVARPRGTSEVRSTTSTEVTKAHRPGKSERPAAPPTSYSRYQKKVEQMSLADGGSQTSGRSKSSTRSRNKIPVGADLDHFANAKALDDHSNDSLVGFGESLSSVGITPTARRSSSVRGRSAARPPSNSGGSNYTETTWSERPSSILSGSTLRAGSRHRPESAVTQSSTSSRRVPGDDKVVVEYEATSRGLRRSRAHSRMRRPESEYTPSEFSEGRGYDASHSMSGYSSRASGTRAPSVYATEDERGYKMHIPESQIKFAKFGGASKSIAPAPSRHGGNQYTQNTQNITHNITNVHNTIIQANKPEPQNRFEVGFVPRSSLPPPRAGEIAPVIVENRRPFGGY